jgi:hypothetical protein
MNKTVMKIVTIIILAGVGLFLLNKNTTQNVQNNETDNTQTTVTPVNQVVIQSPEETIDTFLANFISSAPPNSDQQAIKEAVSALSEGAKIDTTEPTSGDLARFIGVQDVPDSYEVGEATLGDNNASNVVDGLAEVKVTLKYSGGDTERVFLLSKVENNWQIDGVKQ